MRTQLTVRLPNELVEFVDGCVAGGAATSRAAVITAALERERRRLIAERDAVILADLPAADDLDDLAAYAASVSLTGLD